MPKQTDTVSERTENNRLSMFSTSSGISTKKVQLSSEELELQAVLRKREQKAQEKKQAQLFFARMKCKQPLLAAPIAREPTQPKEFSFATG